MTAYYTVPGTSACGVTLYASMIPLSPEERMPSGVVNRFEAGALKGYTAKVSIPDGTWMTSNHRLDPEERKLRMEKTMALSYDMWKDKPALTETWASSPPYHSRTSITWATWTTPSA